MKIVAAQLNPVAGDIKGNLNKIKGAYKKHSSDAELIVFPELFITGYPPKDLLKRPYFLRCVDEGIEELKEITQDCRCGLILGAPVSVEGEKKKLLNSAVFIYNGRKIASQPKSFLSENDFFDERRYFIPGKNVRVFEHMGKKIGLTVSGDLWMGADRKNCPAGKLVSAGAEIVINISASPFCIGEEEKRLRFLKNHALKNRVPFLFVNQVGGNDELVFDGKSLYIDENGRISKAFRGFNEQVELVDTESEAAQEREITEDSISSVYNALVLGVRDYACKCGFSKAVLGISGGVDSSVVSAIAVAALGRENVKGVFMPSRYTSCDSRELAEKLAANIGINLITISIDALYEKFSEELSGFIKPESGVNTAFENIQARIRGNILMALSNENGWLVLCAGNKSELAVGYTTLYGDLSGGLGVLSDASKTMVYRLAEYINSGSVTIPREIISRAPSAELRPWQKDTDTLPSYDILDGILQKYVELSMSPEEIIESGYKEKIVYEVTRAVVKNEYKRRQVPPGLKITEKAFGDGRRMPIAGRYL